MAARNHRDKEGLLPRERVLVDEYAIHKNGRRAGLAAGMKDGPGLGAQVCRMLNSANVRAAIAKRSAIVSERAGVRAEEVLVELKKVGFSNFGDYGSFGPDGLILNNSRDLTNEQLAAVSEVTETVTEHGGSVKFKLHSKVEALKKLGEHFALFQGAVPVPGDPDAPEPGSVREHLVQRLLAIGQRVTLENVVLERLTVDARPGIPGRGNGEGLGGG